MNIRKIAVNAIKENEKKNLLLNEFSNALSPIHDSIFNKTYVYPLTEEKNIELLIKAASELKIYYPKGKIVSLGQSPAWIVATASLMTEDLTKFDGIAFSGAFYDEKDNGNLVRRFPGPKLEQINAYKEYLTRNGFDPLTICNIHTKDNPFVIVEHIHSGKGLVSFLSLLSDWANELGIGSKLKDSLNLHFLMTPQYNFKSSIAYGFNYSIQKVPYDFMIAMANSDQFNDRLLPSYPFHQWKNNVYPVFGGNSHHNAELIAIKLTYALHERNLLDHSLINSKINVQSERLPIYISNISNEPQIRSVVLTNIEQKQKINNKKESAINQPIQSLTLGFLSSVKNAEQKSQQRTYCGLKKGFFN